MATRIAPSTSSIREYSADTTTTMRRTEPMYFSTNVGVGITSDKVVRTREQACMKFVLT